MKEEACRWLDESTLVYMLASFPAREGSVEDFADVPNTYSLPPPRGRACRWFGSTNYMVH